MYDQLINEYLANCQSLGLFGLGVSSLRPSITFFSRLKNSLSWPVFSQTHASFGDRKIEKIQRSDFFSDFSNFPERIGKLRKTETEAYG